jgi:toxin ParE1/3/4
MPHRLAPEAEAELDHIWYYVAKESGNAEIADRLIEFITERFYLLARFPHLGRERDADLRPGLRSFAVGQYVIVCRIEKNHVLILHIIRGSRDALASLKTTSSPQLSDSRTLCPTPRKTPPHPQYSA